MSLKIRQQKVFFTKICKKLPRVTSFLNIAEIVVFLRPTSEQGCFSCGACTAYRRLTLELNHLIVKLTMAGVENIFGRLYTQDSLIECIFLTAGNNGAPSKEEIKLLHKELNVLKGFVSQLPPEDRHSIVQWCNKLASFWNRFLSLKKTETACRIQHKLIVLEFAITNLFTIIPLPIELLKERLKDLEDLVAYIPVECANLAVTWRVKMSNFWLQFTSASSYTLRPIQAFPFDSFQYIPLHGNTHSIASSLVNINFGQFGNPLMTSTMTLLDPLQQADNNGTIVNSMESDFISQESQSRSDMAESYENINSYQEHFSGENNEQSFDPSNDGDEMNNNGHELQEVDPVENVRQVIRNSFSLVEPLSSGSDVDGMKNILNTISTVGKLVLPFHGHINYLKTAIFNCTFAKLPLYKRRQFRRRFRDDRYPLSNLVRMLVVDIVAGTQCDPSSPSNYNSRFRSGRLDFDVCNICQIRGHRISSCHFLYLMLCCKCFLFGHYGKHCQYSP